ncbi:MAG: hypothetical protein AAGC97_15165 [Planctomycetota bacterium]
MIHQMASAASQRRMKEIKTLASAKEGVGDRIRPARLTFKRTIRR